MAELVSDRLLEDRVAKPGDRVVLVHGSPLGLPGQTNSIRLHEITHPSDRGPAPALPGADVAGRSGRHFSQRCAPPRRCRR